MLACCLTLVACGASKVSERPDLDGPGSWGPLQDTVLLRDLELIETQFRNGQWHAYIRDPSGETHDIIAGSFVGENTGRVYEIRDDVLMIMQVVMDDEGNWMEVPIEFRKQ